jgi:hypothetical protein
MSNEILKAKVKSTGEIINVYRWLNAQATKKAGEDIYISTKDYKTEFKKSELIFL